ncbi:unnamed protein product [Victoria cruziana]
MGEVGPRLEEDSLNELTRLLRQVTQSNLVIYTATSNLGEDKQKGQLFVKPASISMEGDETDGICCPQTSRDSWTSY